MLDMFQPQNEKPLTKTDMFGTYNPEESFYWSVAVFNANGASEVIPHAIEHKLHIFYPFRCNKKGNFTPLWKSYLFIEYDPDLTLRICRKSLKFSYFITFNGEPELVPKNAINECLQRLKAGEYNDKVPKTKVLSAGSIVTINIPGALQSLQAKLLTNVIVGTDKKAIVMLNGWKTTIDVNKLGEVA